jgi:hypothetical protein
MPVWAQYIIGASALVLAIGVLWSKVVRPLARMVSLAEEMLPLLARLTEVFKDNPNAFRVLGEIVSQFGTNSGSSLRDVVNRLETAAQASAAAAEVLKVDVAASKQLAEMDRATVRRVEVFLDHLSRKVEEGAATGMRIEKAASGVAEDLAAAHKRADEAGEGEAGAAADAAAQQSVGEKLQSDN